MRFLSTPSARRATAQPEHQPQRLHISIHALREESDLWPMYGARPPSNFYPRPPRGERLHLWMSSGVSRKFLSTPSARRATCFLQLAAALRAISIHALREESDTKRYQALAKHGYFYPRPPRGERPAPKRQKTELGKFLSTPSARRATAKTETKSLFSNKLYNILHEFRSCLLYTSDAADD